MGIDYVVGLACAVKTELGVERMVNLCKARSRGETILKLVRERGDKRSPAEIEFEVVLHTPDGEETSTVSVQSLLDEARALEPLRHHCAPCPANGAAPAFGCYGSMPYPIPAAAEAWLIDLLPADLGSTAGRLFARALVDFGWDGERAAHMRDDGDTFFESREALSVGWGEGDDAVAIDSDQLFHMLFQVGHIGATHAFMCRLFLGFLPHDVGADVLADEAARKRVLEEAKVPPPPDAACQHMASFLGALLAAARLDVDLLVDG